MFFHNYFCIAFLISFFPSDFGTYSGCEKGQINVQAYWACSQATWPLGSPQ